MSLIRTKIVATVGPACSDPATLLQLFQAGADVCRLNFSHGALDQHAAMVKAIRQAAAAHEHPVALLGDLGGPKIRLGPIAGDGMPIAPGDTLVIQRQPITGTAGRVSTTYPQIVDDVQEGHRLLVEDGLLRFLCVEKEPDALVCRCLVGGILKSAKGVNLPNTTVSIPSITERDWQCVDWAIDQRLDYLALSFVRRADDLHLLRQHLRARGATASCLHLIAKIEKADALGRIDAIIEAADGLMVARGDLGVEIDVAQVPILQKDLIRRCRQAGKPVIVATQMLQSMVDQPTPTRAEVSDVANAIFDGTDAVMLSGETAVGKFAVGAVHTMGHIGEVTEQYLDSRAQDLPEPALVVSEMRLSAALAQGTWRIVRHLPVRLVVVWSQSGTTARIFAKSRFPVPIVALSTDACVLRQMALFYGVIPQQMDIPQDLGDLAQRLNHMLPAKGYARPGDRVVLVAGSSMGGPGEMNSVVLHTVGQPWQATPAGHSAASSTAEGL